MQTSGSFNRDANRVPIATDGLICKKTITFTGAAGSNTWGDDGGTLDGAALFSVTGVVIVKVLGVCTTNLAGAGTHAIGIAGDTTIFLPTEAAVDINAGDLVVNNATTGAYLVWGEQQASADNFPEYILNGQDIIMTVATDNIESGVIDYYCIWRPISDDANVVDAGL